LQKADRGASSIRFYVIESPSTGSIPGYINNRKEANKILRGFSVSGNKVSLVFIQERDSFRKVKEDEDFKIRI